MTIDETPSDATGRARVASRTGFGRSPARTSGVYIAIALLAILPVVVFAIVTVRLSSDAIGEQVDDQIGASALASANVVDQHVARLADIVEGTSQRPTVRAAVETRAPIGMRSALESMIDATGNIQLAFLVDSAGTLVDGIPVSPDTVGRNFDFRDWYKGVSSTQETYVSEAFETAAVGTPLIYVVVTPIFSPTDPDVLLGYMGVGQTLESLQGFVDEFAASQGVSLTITDQAGTILSAPGDVPTEIVPLDERAGFVVDSVQPGDVRDMTWEGERRLVGVAPVPSLGWSVTADVPADDALAAVRRITTTVAVVAVMLSAMVLVGVVAVARSLSRRREAVENQARSEAFLKSIIENIPSIVIVKNAETLRIERINRAGQTALGSSNGELIGKNWTDALSPREARERMDEEREILASGEIQDVAVVDLDTPEGVRQFRTRRIPIAPHNNVPGFLLNIYDDISDNLAALADLQAAKSEAERANAAKSDFLSRMSHELRTPLNAVIGFGQLLEMDDPTDEQRESVDQILRGGRHLLGLINEILDLARIETGRLSLSLEPVRVEGIVEEALDLVRPLAAENGIDVPGHLVGDWSHWVFADQQRVKQVLINLLANAIKYNEPNGRVTLGCAAIDDRLRISVTDTGPGIAEEQLSTMFAPFERLGAETSGVEGTGLGLSLSKSLVEAMGGAIGVDTEPGSGSTFWIEIDLAPMLQRDDVEPTERPTPATQIDAAGATILYIEDNPSNVRLIERLVDQRTNTTLINAETGEQGIDLANEHLPDLVLLDVNLPGLDGHEVLRALRDEPTTKHIPVIMLSADATPSQIDRLLESGADHYLTKPIEIAELMSTIDEELELAPG